MKNYIKEAYKAGYAAGLEKSASKYKVPGSSIVGQYTQPDDINRMLFGLAAGGATGAMIGGKYNRKGGAIGGALAGVLASNPGLFLALINQGSGHLHDFVAGRTRL